jgi:hypothetical protein
VSRGIWFVAGAGAGVYAMVKARRAAETFTPEGVRDRLAGLSLGAHLFGEEVRAGMTEKETELRERLGWTADGPAQLAGPDEEKPFANERSAPHHELTTTLEDTP